MNLRKPHCYFGQMALALALLLASACDVRDTATDQRTLVRSDGDDRRPIEDSESLPGYLVDPNMIAISRPHADTLVRIVGSAGSIKIVTPGTPVILWEVLPEAMSAAVVFGQGRVLEANKLLEVEVHADGSFEYAGEVAVAAGNVLGISVGSDQDDSHVLVRKNSIGKVSVSYLPIDSVASAATVSPRALDPDDQGTWDPKDEPARP